MTDILAPGLDIIFCGINPGSRAAASGHHFDGRGNRFWRVMHLAGFTPRLMTPEEDRQLLPLGYGLTTVVERCTARASQVAAYEFISAAENFTRKIAVCKPRRLAFLGKAAYTAITSQKEIAWGRQPARFAGAEAWLLPNPSGLNRSFSLDDLVAAYRALHDATSSR